MATKNWSDLSFTPDGKPTVKFRCGTVTFPAVEKRLNDDEPEDSEDFGLEHCIRIHSSNIGDIPEFALGEIGTFRGACEADGLQYRATNATVVESRAGYLILEANSRDNATELSMDPNRYEVSEPELLRGLGLFGRGRFLRDHP